MKKEGEKWRRGRNGWRRRKGEENEVGEWQICRGIKWWKRRDEEEEYGGSRFAKGERDGEEEGVVGSQREEKGGGEGRGEGSEEK